MTRSSKFFIAAFMAIGAGVAWPAMVSAQQGPGASPEPVAVLEDGPPFLISAFEPVFTIEHPGLPLREQVLQYTIRLGRVADGFVAARPGVPTVQVTLSQVPQMETRRFYASAIQSINQQLVDHLNRQGLAGVYIAPDERDIEPRMDRLGTMRLVIEVALVKEVRTVASGDRVPEGQKLNFPGHAWIAERSPVRPSAEAGGPGPDLLRRDLLEAYLYRLNRHPGRRVDVKLVASEVEDEGAGVALEYLVSEDKPWTALVQGSNTGTKSTDEWRENFALIHNQLTGHDDVLSVTYSTAGFEASHAVIASYEAALGEPGGVLRWGVSGAWSEFQASDVGFPQDVFFGDSTSVEGRLLANVYQDRDLFVDAYAKLQWQNIHVRNEKFAPLIIEGNDDFLLPGVGILVERSRLRDSIDGSIGVEWNLPGVAGTKTDEIEKLGRSDVDSSWEVVKWDLRYAFYLEPLIDYEAWADVSDPRGSTLAHEVVLSCRGQYAFGHRLVPQFQQTVGGLYTVRGYDQSLTTGDAVLLMSAEYRCHIPRSLQPQPEPGTLFGQPFRWAPKQAFGLADWDLILRGFVDFARTNNSELGANLLADTETNETLLGVGVGGELQFKRNLSVRVDFGWALEHVEETDPGDSEVHFVGTLLF